MSHVQDAHKYARQVVAGKIPACKWVKMACKRQLADQRNKNFDYFFDEREAEKVCNFIENLHHVKGVWAKRQETIKLELWQKFIYCMVFGWKHKETKLRRFKTVYIEVARKNTKSTMTAGAGLYMETEDGEEGAECYSVATKRDQAKIVFDVASAMVRKDADFQYFYKIKARAHDIICEDTNSKFEPLSADASSLDGLNTHFGGIDELHAHKTRAVYDVMETSTGSRSQPLIWCITTSGSNREGICYEIRAYVTKILQNVQKDETFFGIIYTLDEGDDWKDEKNWIKANPNLEVSVSILDLRSKCAKALETPSAINNFKTKHLDIWVNAAEAWLDMLKWDACGDSSLQLAAFAGRECFLAVDLASKLDIAAKVRLFLPEKNGKKCTLFCTFWIPEDAVRESSNSQYSGWVHEGRLLTTAGSVIDLDAIELSIKEDFKQFKVLQLAYDPFQATQLINHIAEFLGPFRAEKTIVEIGATVKNFSEPMKELEKKIVSSEIQHDNNPVMGWMMSNVVCFRDAKDNIYPRKETFTAKIDGPVAAIMAMNRYLARATQPSVYENRPMRML